MFLDLLINKASEKLVAAKRKNVFSASRALCGMEKMLGKTSTTKVMLTRAQGLGIIENPLTKRTHEVLEFFILALY